jgi:hypothetical protein
MIDNELDEAYQEVCDAITDMDELGVPGGILYQLVVDLDNAVSKLGKLLQERGVIS